MSVSVVLPAFNEAGNIGPLVRETASCLGAIAECEIIVVDDASEDDTPREVQALLVSVPQLVYLRHAARAGQSAAIRTGVKAARYPVIATMDGDGQNDPSDIGKLLEAMRSFDLDLVGGVRVRRNASASKRFASRFANGLRQRLLQDTCPDTGCGLKVFRREAFLDLPYFSGMHRYLPALFQAYELRTAYEPVNDRPRRAGVSKYTNFGRGLIGIYDLIGVRWLIRRTVLSRAPAVDRRPASSASSPSTAVSEDQPCLQL